MTSQTWNWCLSLSLSEKKVGQILDGCRHYI